MCEIAPRTLFTIVMLSSRLPAQHFAGTAGCFRSGTRSAHDSPVLVHQISQKVGQKPGGCAASEPLIGFYQPCLGCQCVPDPMGTPMAAVSSNVVKPESSLPRTAMQLAAVRSDADNLSDCEIAQRIAAGDSDELQRLMRRYNQLLYRTARSILRDDAEAEDAVQEAYFLAYRSMGRFRGGAKLSTWLVRIVANEAIGRLRKRSRRAELIHMSGTAEPIERRPGAERDRHVAGAARGCGNHGRKYAGCSKRRSTSSPTHFERSSCCVRWKK